MALKSSNFAADFSPAMQLVFAGKVLKKKSPPWYMADSFSETAGRG
jgi:hypothetical protein